MYNAYAGALSQIVVDRLFEIDYPLQLLELSRVTYNLNKTISS